MIKRIRLVSAVLVGLLLIGCSAAGTASPVPVVTDTPAPITIRVGFASEADFLDLPSLMAHDALAKQGYIIEPIFYSETGLAAEGLARGDTDFGLGAFTAFWAAIDKGADLTTIMEHNGNSWSIMANSTIAACDDLDGKRIGISSESAVSTILSKAYVQRYCPEIDPEYLVLGRSSARAAALLAGEIDATTLELADAVELEQEAPGQFHALTKFAEDLPAVRTTGVQVNKAFAAAQPQAVKDYIKATLLIHRQLALDASPLSGEASKRLELKSELLPALIDAHLTVKSWDVNGGLTVEAVQATLDFFIGAGDLDEGLTVARVSDLSFLNTVLDELGRH